MEGLIFELARALIGKLREKHNTVAFSIRMAAVDEDMREKAAAVEDFLCYSFKDKTLLQKALTHPSYPDSPSYERLEFLGDAALGLAIAEYGFQTYPELNPGQLTLLRAANVDTDNLAYVAVRRDLYRFVRRKDPSLDDTVKKFVEAVKDEEGTVPYCGSVKAPKILADIVESIAAAVYIDCNRDLKALWEVFKRILEPLVTPETLHKHSRSTTLLYELCQKQGKKVEIKDNWKGSVVTAGVYVDGKLMGAGSSEQRKIARFKAANEALKNPLLNSLDPPETVTEDDHGDEDGEIKGAKSKLNELYLTHKETWRQPKYKIETEFGPPNEKKYICSVEVETVDDTYFRTGEIRSKLKDAENSAASVMLLELER